MTVDKPVKGGGRKPSPRVAGRTMTDQELIAAAAQAAVQAVMQMQPQAAPAEEPARVKPMDLDEEGKANAEEAAEIKAQQKAAKERAAHADALASDLVPFIVRDRHLDVYRWMKGGNSDAAFLKQILAGVLAKALPKFREANGQISASSTNIELLTDNLPGA